jgi:hypothetical protein
MYDTIQYFQRLAFLTVRSHTTCAYTITARRCLLGPYIPCHFVRKASLYGLPRDILPSDEITIDGVWFHNRIYWTLTLVTTNHYDSLTEFFQRCNWSTYKVFSVFTSRCLVAASNGGLFPSSGFPNCLRPQLPASHFSQLQLSTDSTNSTQKVEVMWRLTISRPVCLGVKHPSGIQDQIFVTVRHLWVYWCGVPSLTRGRVAAGPRQRSHSQVRASWDS